MIHRTTRTLVLLLTSSCFCQRCADDIVSDTLFLDFELGNLGADCTGTDRLTTDGGTFDVRYAVETADDGTELCTVLATWEDGTLFDFAGATDSVPVPPVGLPVEYYVEQMQFRSIDLLTLARVGDTPIDPVDAGLQIALGTRSLDIDSDDAFSNPDAVVFEKDRGEDIDRITPPLYGPERAEDFHFGTWPLLDAANFALTAESTLDVQGRARITFPMSELDDAEGSARLSLRLNSGVSFLIGAYACQLPLEAQ